MAAATAGTKAMRSMTEFMRRADAAEAHRKGADRPEFVTSLAVLKDPTQEYVLYNVAHVRNGIRSPDGKAWVRWLGVFPDKTSAQVHANRVIRREPGGLDTRMFPVGMFFGISRDKYADKWVDQVVLDASGAPCLGPDGMPLTRRVNTFFDEASRVAEAKKVARLEKRHAKTRRNQKREVKANAMRRRMGETASSLAQKLAEDVDEEAAAEAAAAAAAARKLEDEENAALVRMDLDVAGGAEGDDDDDDDDGVAARRRAAARKAAATDGGDAAADVPAKASAAVVKVKDEDAKVEEDDEADDVAETEAKTEAKAEAKAADASAPIVVRRGQTTLGGLDSVKSVPRKLELRMQKFMAMAVIDDYYTLDKHEKVVDEWCARADAAYKVEREAMLWRTLEANGRIRKRRDGTLVPYLVADREARAADKKRTPEEAAARDAAKAAAAKAAEEAVLAAAHAEAVATGQDVTKAAEAARWPARCAGVKAAAEVDELTTAATAAEAAAGGLTLADVLPPMHHLVRKWLTKSMNLPPPGYNVWGEFIGAASREAEGWLKARRADVVAAKAAFNPSYDEAADADLTPRNDREIAIWLQMRDMRVEEQTWRWAGADHLPLRAEILARWLAVPDNARPNLDALEQEEPAVAAFRAFESEPEAQKWARQAERVHELRDHDMQYVAMYEWLPLELRHSDAVPRTYRNEHENDIMASKAEQAARAKELALEARTTKRKMRVVTVANNAVVTGQELPEGLSAAEWARTEAATRKTKAETDAELAAMAAAEKEGRTYTSTKLAATKLERDTMTLAEAGFSTQADFDAAVKEVAAAEAAARAAEAERAGGGEDEEEGEEVAVAKPKKKVKKEDTKTVVKKISKGRKDEPTRRSAPAAPATDFDMDLSAYKPRK